MEINDYFTMSDEIDRDKEIEVYLVAAPTYINKQDAQKIVDHLTKVFDLEIGE